MNRFLRGCLVSLLAALLGGCSTVSGWMDRGGGRDLPELASVENAIPLQVRWSRDVGDGVGELHSGLQAAVAGDRVYGAGADGRVGAYDAATGESVWRVELERPVSGGPAVGDGLVVVGTNKGEVFALDVATGEQRWQAGVSSEVLAPPAIGAGVVAVRTLDGRLFGLDGRTGKRRWIYDSPVPVLSLRGTGEPVIAGELVLNGFDGGRLVALLAGDGRVEWEQQVAIPRGRSELERMVDMDSRPVVVDDAVYVTAFQGRVAALDLLSGSVLWDRDLSSHAGVAVDAAAVYVSDADGFVWALDRFSGNSLWRQTDLEKRRITAPVRVGDYVVVGDEEGLLHWLSVEDGGFVARTRVDDDGIASAPATGRDGRLYVYGNSGRITAFEAP
ncbi:MAG: outer membrane protein assembly factor BamB [Gammaproteobacteria bacterium]|nr:outer membrane protein assembly factor BamB [Gammaproteobacteria bacterium]